MTCHDFRSLLLLMSELWPVLLVQTHHLLLSDFGARQGLNIARSPDKFNTIYSLAPTLKKTAEGVPSHLSTIFKMAAILKNGGYFGRMVG